MAILCRIHLISIGITLLTLASVGAEAQPGEDDERQRQILVIYSDTSTLSASVGIAAGLRDALDGALAPHYNLHTEFRAIDQFPEPKEELRFVDMLARKYGDRQIDLVLVLGPAALRIAILHRERFASDAPVVAGAVTERTLPDPRPDYLSAALGSFDLGETVALARRMQPGAKRIVVFTGSAEFDDTWKARAQSDLAGETEIAVDYVSGRTLAEFEAEAAGLTPDTILLILTIFKDAAGARFKPAEAAALIAEVSGAPSWSVYSTFVGNGVVGGVVETFEIIGRTVGELALDILEEDEASGRVLQVPSVPVVDWLAARRFGLDKRLIPGDAVLLNYDPPVWERYLREILLILAVVLAQTATIAALIVQGRRRRAAEQEVADRRLQLAQMSRISQLGELSGAITHELNQPLTAILANAEAGSLMLKKSPPDLQEVASVLADIAADDQRASRILVSLRRLMRRREVALEPVDINEVVRAVERLTRSEFLMRGVRLVVRASTGRLTVFGDVEQCQQVLLNLLLNAADAMEDQPPETRIIEVETTERADGWRQIAVQDSGPGLSPNMRQDPFQAFATTKENGMGIGLSISRSIADAHGGVLEFEHADRGARIVFALPPA